MLKVRRKKETRSLASQTAITTNSQVDTRANMPRRRYHTDWSDKNEYLKCEVYDVKCRYKNKNKTTTVEDDDKA